MVLGLILKSDPFLFQHDTKVSPQLIWNAVRWKKPDPSVDLNGELRMYRGNPQRNAVFNVERLEEFYPSWKSSRINHGIHGASKASVISDSESIYVGSDTSWFYCFDQKTGNLNWKIYLGDSSRGIHSTAALDEHSVYVGSYRGSVYRIDKRSGEIIWMRIIGETAGASPLITDQHILFNIETNQPNGYLIKLNKL